MGAKGKLNSANFLGSLFVAGLIGGVTDSFPVFLISFAGLLVAGFLAGDIRR